MLFALLACQDPSPVPPGADDRPDESAWDSPSPDSHGPLQPLILNEAQSSNGSTLELEDGSSPDWIELYNPGPRSADLAGWTLSDGGDPFDLAGESLLPGEFLLLYADETHLPFRLSSEGETLTLLDPHGRLVDELEVPALRRDTSYGPGQIHTEWTLLAQDARGLLSLVEEPGWTELDHDDDDWTEVIQAVGFDGVDPDQPPTNVALGQPCEQSTDGWGYTGPEAVDGELSTFTHTATSDFEPWWEVDLGEDYGVSELRLFNRVGCCPERLYNLTVLLLDEDDQAVWTSEVLNPVTDTAVDPGELLTVYPDEIGRKVRVQKEAIGGTYESEWLSLAEVEVMGVTASPYRDVLATDLSESMKGQTDTAFLRLPFSSTESPQRLVLRLFADDRVSAWLNGELLLDEVEGSGAEALELTLDPALLLEGDNLLALRGSTDDQTFLLGAELLASSLEQAELAWFAPPTPGAPNGLGFQGYVEDPLVDVERGFFEDAFTLELSCPTADATLVYTTDGSAPSLDNGTQVQLDGQSPSARLEIATTSLLRAAAFKEELEPSRTITHTYLFLEDVLDQPADPAGFPATWDGMSQAAITADYEMDPEVVEASREELLAGLRDVRTMSLVMDPEDLFGDEAGIYVHSTQRGDAWERITSVEILETDGSTGVQVDAGVRVHGYGWRPHSNTRKHSLRLEFRDRYGPSKLEYALFPDAPVERFDSVVLRSQGSRGWQDFRDPEQAQYLRDAFARDTARDMGKTDGHATYVHLYLNGLYWGLYNPVERPDADFGAEYFGGEPEDYDAINRRTTTNEAIDGTLDAYNELLALADEDLSEDYSAVEAVLDVQDLIDYMLIHQYTTNRDGPEEFSSNNMRGVRNREGGLWRWFVWDMEYSLWEADDDYNIEVDVPGSISHVYARLRTNPEFLQRYSDRAHEHLTGEGALTPAASLARYEARAEEIERAVLGESARWGDAKREPPYTRDVEWAEERRRLTEEYFPARTDELIALLRAAGLWTD